MYAYTQISSTALKKLPNLTIIPISGTLFAERLANVQAMTGLADQVYVEGFLQVHSFDLLLELLLVNRSNDILQNVTVELCTQGDLRIVDRPTPVTLMPGQQSLVHASIKVRGCYVISEATKDVKFKSEVETQQSNNSPYFSEKSPQSFPFPPWRCAASVVHACRPRRRPLENAKIVRRMQLV
jgi:hypothetical protein